MIIAPDFRKCVSYLFIDKEDPETGKVRRVPVATAFFVSIPMPGSSFQAVYAVTARHVIRGAYRYGPLYIRLNLANGTFVELIAPHDVWIEHPGTDIALCPILMPQNHDIKHIPMNLLAAPEFIAQNKVMEGDDIFFCGMFQGLPGQEKMQPIIRFGNISLMPHEKIALKDNPESEPYWSDAYLVEAKSWGGHSGSPTFLYLSPNRIPGQITFGIDQAYFALLGLVSSHFEISQEIQFLGDVLGSGSVGINAGLAIVIPASYLIELLLSEEIVEQRNKIAAIIQTEKQPSEKLIEMLERFARPVVKIDRNLIDK